MLKKAASGVLGPLSCSRTPLYAPHTKEPAALAVERRVLARRGWEGKEGGFLNILPWSWCKDARTKTLENIDMLSFSTAC